MKKSRLIPLVLIFCLALTLFCPLAMAESDPYADTFPYVSSKYALVADMDSGRVLFEQGEYNPEDVITAPGLISDGGLFDHVWVWIVLILLLAVGGFTGYMQISYKRHNRRLAKCRQGAHEVKK